MISRSSRFKHDHYRRRVAMPVVLPVLVVLLLGAIPAGAENLQDSGPAHALVAELSPRSADPGFADLAISKSRSLGNLTDSVTLLSALLAKGTSISAAREIYVELASMQELLGRYDEAGNAWEAAIAARPGQGEPAWLLSAAACRLATGDIDAAVALAKATLLTTASPRFVALAMLIEARGRMFTGDFTGARARSLEALAVKASGFEAAALALARDASSGAEREAYAKRLLQEYPGRPEAQNAPSSIYALAHPDLAQSLATRTTAPDTGAGAVSTTMVVRQTNSAGEAVSSPLFYQLGAFRDESNAILLAGRLVQAGFRPRTIRRESRSGVLSIVYLDAGSDPARLMIALKDAGFESWPLFSEP